MIALFAGGMMGAAWLGVETSASSNPANPIASAVFGPTRESDLSPRATKVFGRWLAETLGGPGLHLARLELRDIEKGKQDKLELRAALAELKSTWTNLRSSRPLGQTRTPAADATRAPASPGAMGRRNDNREVEDLAGLVGIELGNNDPSPVRLTTRPAAMIYDWRHYLAVVQRKPEAPRNGAPFAELPPAFRALQQRMLKTPGGDLEMPRGFLSGRGSVA